MINEGVKMWPVNSTYYRMHDVEYKKKKVPLLQTKTINNVIMKRILWDMIITYTDKLASPLPNKTKDHTEITEPLNEILMREIWSFTLQMYSNFI